MTETPTGEDEVAQRAIEQLLTQLPSSTPDEFSAQAASRQPWAEVAAPSTKGKVSLETFLADYGTRLRETPASEVSLPAPSPAQLYLDELLSAPKSRKKKRKKGKKQETSSAGMDIGRRALPRPGLNGGPSGRPATRNPGRGEGGRGRFVPGEPLFAEPYIPPTDPIPGAQRPQSDRSPVTEGQTRSARRRRRRRSSHPGVPPQDGSRPSGATLPSTREASSPPSQPSS